MYLFNTSQMKIAPFTVLFLLFCLLACKKNEKKTNPIPPALHKPVELKKPDLEQMKPVKEKDKNSLMLDSLKVKTASF